MLEVCNLGRMGGGRGVEGRERAATEWKKRCQDTREIDVQKNISLPCKEGLDDRNHCGGVVEGEGDPPPFILPRRPSLRSAELTTSGNSPDSLTFILSVQHPIRFTSPPAASPSTETVSGASGLRRLIITYGEILGLALAECEVYPQSGIAAHQGRESAAAGRRFEA